MTGIPDPGRASGFFGALDRSRPVEMFTYANTHHVRVIRDGNGDPWWVLADLCRVLGLSNPSMVADRLLADGLSRTEVTDALGRPQQVTLCDESNMYEVVLRSDKAEAIEFRRWITGEVLPQIRKTGTYSRLPAQPTALPSKRELAQWVIDAEERAERAESKVVELSGPASSWNELAEAAGDYSVADAAKVLSRDPNISTGERRLFKQMQGLGWIYRRDGHWSAYQAQLDTGRLAEKVGQRYWKPIADQWIVPIPTIRITPKGLQELHKRLGGKGEQLTLAVAE